ncbi:MAG: transglutaminase family protein [Deltaproteobacteria bacterium]|nr:MAG: transglutaminase family protein [Deltaproteobacteria bacterium]
MADPSEIVPLAPEACLVETERIDFSHPRIQALLARLGLAGQSPRNRAVRLFRFVRDEIRYTFMAQMDREAYRASAVLEAGAGFCVQKGMLLCALGRGAGIPTALVLSDLEDASLSPRIARALGTNVMFHHGLNAFYLDGAWRFVDASLSPDVVQRKGYRPVVFDGTADALQAGTTLAGKPHARYLKFHGMYVDLPYEQMIAAFIEAYRNADLAALGEILGERPTL